MSKILVVDDELSMRDFLSIMLKKEGHEVVVAENGGSALKVIQAEIFDLLITDIKMPGVDGMEVLKSVKEVSPETVVIMITAFASTGTAVEAMKLGAYDYITKPFKVDEIRMVIQKALEKRHLRKENILLRREIASRAGFANFIGTSAAMQRVFSLIRQVADTKSTVLITGESGTGKELVAKAIHFNSSRNGGPFVTVNCGALPETLLESELFGYMKGAFTGATSNKQGLFEAANGGTIFLDEISATTPALQIKLLRVLQEREFMRVGGTVDIKMDARVIAASNRDLLAEISKGTFREDLYYRLNVIPINLPTLRDRREDIPPLCAYFLEKHLPSSRKKITGFSKEAMDVLMHYSYPGNVRELENIVERAIILEKGHLIAPENLPQTIKTFQIETLEPDKVMTIEELNKEYAEKVLEMLGGNKSKAAEVLGISRTSLWRILKEE
jgi:two-component system response regulator PilR (NtrC family)